MWKCMACGLEMMFRAVTPEVDEAGCYFLCIGCGHRNGLEALRNTAGELELMQRAGNSGT